MKFKMRSLFFLLVTLLLFGFAKSQVQITIQRDPVEEAKLLRISQLTEQAYQHVRACRDEDAIALLREASAIERSCRGFRSGANVDLARIYVRNGRLSDAISAYKHAFAWDAQREELGQGLGGAALIALDYSLLLSREGDSEGAKAMYYYALRQLKDMPRQQEPAPLLVVFDADPEGISWEYAPQRLEAAALMVQAMLGGTYDPATREKKTWQQLVARVQELAPDWFYPYLFRASKLWNDDRGRELLHHAESLARPGLEREIVARYRSDLAEHIEWLRDEGLGPTSDRRPMTAGTLRRSRMLCLRPNEQVLRRVAIDLPGR